MDTVGEQAGRAAQRRKEVDDTDVPLLCDLVDEREDFILNDRAAYAEIAVKCRNWFADPDLGRAGQFRESVDQIQVIGNVFIFVHPVVGFGVVRPQLNNHHVRLRREGLAVSALLDVGLIAFSQQSRAADAEVLRFPLRIELLQHPPQLGGVGIVRPVRNPRAVGNTVPNTRH